MNNEKLPWDLTRVALSLHMADVWVLMPSEP